MYDYREDLKTLINKTQNTPESLELTRYALEIYLKLLKNVPEKADETKKVLQTINNNTQVSKKDSSKSEIPSLKIIKRATPNVNAQKELLPPNTYRVKRLLSGAELYDDNNRKVAYFAESKIHNSDWYSGDWVELNPNSSIPEVTKIIAKHDKHADEHIKTFKYGIVEDNPAKLIQYVAQNINGEKLSDLNPTITDYYVIPTQFLSGLDVKAGNLITLAWDDREPYYIRVRWQEETETSNIVSKPSSPKNVKKEKNENKSKINKAENESCLDFDLHQQTVAIIVGDKQREDELQKLVASHNGKATTIDAFYHQNSPERYFEQQLSNTDIVILVQNYNKHNTSKYVLKNVRNYNLKFAITNSLGITSVEQALYRADNGLEAYEPSGSTIKYPTK